MKAKCSSECVTCLPTDCIDLTQHRDLDPPFRLSFPVLNLSIVTPLPRPRQHTWYPNVLSTLSRDPAVLADTDLPLDVRSVDRQSLNTQLSSAPKRAFLTFVTWVIWTRWLSSVVVTLLSYEACWLSTSLWHSSSRIYRQPLRPSTIYWSRQVGTRGQPQQSIDRKAGAACKESQTDLASTKNHLNNYRSFIEELADKRRVLVEALSVVDILFATHARKERQWRSIACTTRSQKVDGEAGTAVTRECNSPLPLSLPTPLLSLSLHTPILSFISPTEPFSFTLPIPFLSSPSLT